MSQITQDIIKLKQKYGTSKGIPTADMIMRVVTELEKLQNNPFDDSRNPFCAAYKEDDCLISGSDDDATCAMIRKYLNK